MISGPLSYRDFWETGPSCSTLKTYRKSTHCKPFLQFSLWFSVFVNNDGGCSNFFSTQRIWRFFLVFPRKLPRSHAKTVIPRNHVQLGEWVTLTLSLADVIWDLLTATKQTIASCLPLFVSGKTSRSLAGLKAKERLFGCKIKYVGCKMGLPLCLHWMKIRTMAIKK